MIGGFDGSWKIDFTGCQTIPQDDIGPTNLPAKHQAKHLTKVQLSPKF